MDDGRSIFSIFIQKMINVFLKKFKTRKSVKMWTINENMNKKIIYDDQL